MESIPKKGYFAKELALKTLFGDQAFSDLKKLLDPCCGIGVDKICTDPCGVVSCQDIKTCIGVSDSGDPTLILNKVGDWISLTSSVPGGAFQDVQINDGSGNFFGDSSFTSWGGVINLTGNGNSSIWGNAQAFLNSPSSEAGISLNNTGAGGTAWSIISTSNASGIGGGNFSIGNGANALMLDTARNLYLFNSIRRGNNSMAIDLQSSILSDGVIGTSIDWLNRLMYNQAGNLAIDYDNYWLVDYSTVNALDWGNRTLDDSVGTHSVLWNQRTLRDVGGNDRIDWGSVAGLIKLIGVPTYANDADAIANSLTSGDLYKTTTAGTTALNIVP